MSRPFAFVTCDVFTARPFAGNQLAVVLDAAGLDDTTMQAIAREFNYAETSFVLPPADPRHAARVRIFTPAAEMPFAGHPTIGTAVVLAQQGRAGSGARIVLEENIGPVEVRLDETSGATGGATLTAPRLPVRSTEALPSVDALARILGVPADRVLPDISAWSVGIPFLVVPLVDADALAACRLDDSAFMAALGHDPQVGLYPVAQRADGAWAVRMFAPALGVREDPATGSAAASFAGWLAERVPATGAPGTHRDVLHQGAAIGRPSVLRVEFDTVAQSGATRLADVRVGGDVVRISEGHLLA